LRTIDDEPLDQGIAFGGQQTRKVKPKRGASPRLAFCVEMDETRTAFEP
jgi:hypothetical protein